MDLFPGYSAAKIALTVGPFGEILVGDQLVTDSHGWLEVPTLVSALACGAPNKVRLQLRGDTDVHGHVILKAGRVDVHGSLFDDPEQIHTPWADFWRASLTTSVMSEIERRAGIVLRPTTRLRAVRPPSQETTDSEEEAAKSERSA
jgi:hypothetical protein